VSRNCTDTANLDDKPRVLVYDVSEPSSAKLVVSRSLTESERPAELQGADLQAYESALDEQAFPFEEKAIEFHKKNLEMMRAGTFNAWIEKSLGRLAELVPGRYARPEVSDGFLEAIESYGYRRPVPPPPPPPAPAPAGDATQTAPTEPATQPTPPPQGH